MKCKEVQPELDLNTANSNVFLEISPFHLAQSPYLAWIYLVYNRMVLFFFFLVILYQQKKDLICMLINLWNSSFSYNKGFLCKCFPTWDLCVFLLCFL